MPESGNYPLIPRGGDAPPATSRQIQKLYQHLAESQAQMWSARVAFVQAMDDISGLYGYGQFKIMTTLAGVNQMYVVAKANGMVSAEVDRRLAGMALSYVNEIEAAFRTGSHEILLDAAEAAARRPEPPSLIERLLGG